MKFTVAKQTLHDSVSWMGKTLPRNPISPLDSAITITATPDNIVTFSATDKDSSAHSTLDMIIDTPGTVIVQGRILTELIRNFQDTDITLERTSNGSCEIYNQFAKFTLPGISSDYAPMIPPAPESIGVISSADFKEIARQVANIAKPPTDEQGASVISGMKIEFTNTHITCVATDRFRLAVKKIPWTPTKPVPDDAFVVAYAPRIKNVIEGLFDTKTAGKNITLAGDYTDFSTLGIIMDAKCSLSRLFQHEWVNYTKLLPQTITTTAVVNREDLLSTLKRISIIVSGANPRIALSVTSGTLTITRIDEDGQDGVEHVNAITNGDDITLGFNAYYLIEALNLYSTENITIGINTPHSPVVITETLENQELNVSQLDYLFIVMPLRLGGSV